MSKKNASPAKAPSTFQAVAPSADNSSGGVVVADTPKVAFEITYTIVQRGHNPEVRDVVVAAEKMSEAVAYVEDQGGVVQRCSAVLNGAQFINL